MQNLHLPASKHRSAYMAQLTQCLNVAGVRYAPTYLHGVITGSRRAGLSLAMQIQSATCNRLTVLHTLPHLRKYIQDALGMSEDEMNRRLRMTALESTFRPEDKPKTRPEQRTKTTP